MDWCWDEQRQWEGKGSARSVLPLTRGVKQRRDTGATDPPPPLEWILRGRKSDCLERSPSCNAIRCNRLIWEINRVDHSTILDTGIQWKLSHSVDVRVFTQNKIDQDIGDGFCTKCKQSRPADKQTEMHRITVYTFWRNRLFALIALWIWSPGRKHFEANVHFFFRKVRLLWLTTPWCLSDKHLAVAYCRFAHTRKHTDAIWVTVTTSPGQRNRER